MIVKVKEPLAEERKLLRPGQILFTYLHLAPDLPQTQDLIESGAVCIAYETVTDAQGHLPLLTPMSEVAGRLAPQVGAHALEKAAGRPRRPARRRAGRLRHGNVVILGGGVSGSHAATIAVGMGGDGHCRRPLRSKRLRRLSAQFGVRPQDGLFDPRLDRRDWGQRGGPRDRRGAAAGRRGAEAHHQADAQDDATGFGARRHRHRPGRLLRDVKADDPLEPDLRCGRSRGCSGAKNSTARFFQLICFATPSRARLSNTSAVTIPISITTSASRRRNGWRPDFYRRPRARGGSVAPRPSKKLILDRINRMVRIQMAV